MFKRFDLSFLLSYNTHNLKERVFMNKILELLVDGFQNEKPNAECQLVFK